GSPRFVGTGAGDRRLARRSSRAGTTVGRYREGNRNLRQGKLVGTEGPESTAARLAARRRFAEPAAGPRVRGQRIPAARRQPQRHGADQPGGARTLAEEGDLAAQVRRGDASALSGLRSSACNDPANAKP